MLYVYHDKQLKFYIQYNMMGLYDGDEALRVLRYSLT